MKLKIVFISALLSLTLQSRLAYSQGSQITSRPKLIVGIVVDQMRYDYLAKYYEKFSENGFKKLLNQGFNCRNTNYNYAPTYTGPGHSAIYTGTTPAYNGIIGNDWFVRETNKTTYVTDDDAVQTVGSTSERAGKMSPRNMLSSTIGDELRLFSNMKSKVIAIALKDRASILPGGHLSNGSYWFDSQSGNFITSTYYRKELPRWVEDFNAKRLAEKYLSQPWNTLLPIGQYTESTADDSPYEGLFKGETKPVFPHNLPAMYTKNDYEVLRSTPFGNSITKDMALAAIKGENLGKGPYPDFLAVSFSSTDYIGHKMGPQSIEVEDTYLRLDRDIAELISALEKIYGKDGFLMFLTADHGAAYVPQQLMDLNMNAGYFSTRVYADSLKNHLNKMFHDTSLVSDIINNQVYLNLPRVKQKGINLKDLENEVISVSLSFKGVANAYTSGEMNGPVLNNKSAELMQNGFFPKRSGDIALLLEPQWLDDYSHTGTSHGSTYNYDTHVPLLWYGWNIKPGYTSEPVNITDIAPTITAFLNITAPNACTGKPIGAIIK
ncbi:MAG: alkaline phosphatase PafA [Prolixibacteraceae bacterium]|jgi:predicted AlkP superfamily pyrophosphatase or phosphodiesterase